MGARQDPGFVGHARRVRAQRDEVAAQLDHAQVLLHFLRNDVAENAALLLLEVFAAGAQFVEHAAGHESGRGQLRSGMLELLSGAGSVILEDADVLEAPIALQVLNALRGQQQELFDLGVAGVPQLAVMRGIFHQHFVRADRAHAVVNAVAAAGRRRLRCGTEAWDARRRAPTTARRGVPDMLAMSCGGFAASRDRTGRTVPSAAQRRERRRR